MYEDEEGADAEFEAEFLRNLDPQRAAQVLQNLANYSYPRSTEGTNVNTENDRKLAN